MFDHSQPAEYMTPEEAVVYLRLDTKPGDAHERLRNLIRRQLLPVVRRGGLQLFRRASIDAWLVAGERGGFKVGRRANTPARKVGA